MVNYFQIYKDRQNIVQMKWMGMKLVDFIAGCFKYQMIKLTDFKNF